MPRNSSRLKNTQSSVYANTRMDVCLFVVHEELSRREERSLFKELKLYVKSAGME